MVRWMAASSLICGFVTFAPAVLFKVETSALVGAIPGSFQISFVNNGGQVPGLSNMAVFFRQAATSVPEPATLTLLGLGLLAFSFLQRRKIPNR